MGDNGSNGFSAFDALFEKVEHEGSLDENSERDECDRKTGEVVALRAALHALLRSGALDKVGEQFAEGFGEGKRNLEPALIAKAQRAGPRAVARYRAFSEVTDEIIEKLRVVGRRSR